MKLLPFAFVVALTACTAVPSPENTPVETGSGTASMPLHDSQAPVIVDTGSLIPAHQMLPSGVLELGNPQAPHTLIVFTEFHCKYCAEFHQEQVPLLLADYVDANVLKLQIVPFVLKKYPNSADGAKGALCAAQQGKGREMQAALFKNSSKHYTSVLVYAKELELHEDTMTNCMTSSGATMLLAKQKAWADTLEVTLVPTFFLDGEKFIGLPYYADLRGRIENVTR